MPAGRAHFAASSPPENSGAGSAPITSKENRWLKRFRAELSGERSEANVVAIEGPHLVEEALRSGIEMQAVLLSPAGERHLDRLGLAGAGGGKRNAGPRILRTTERLFAATAATESPQGIAALVRLPEYSFDDVMSGVPLVPVLLGVQDPGNVGAIVRSAEAFGATGLIAAEAGASPFGPKAMRASAGSVFRLPILVRGRAPLVLTQLRVAGVQLIATTAAGVVPGLRTVSLEEVELRGPAAVLIGSEAHGLSDVTLRSADLALRIRLARSVESLNAAVAASVTLYEAARQRSYSWRKNVQSAADAAEGLTAATRRPGPGARR